MSINKLATFSARPPSSIKNILYCKRRNPKLITIKMICDGLGVTLGEFFSTPEFDALEQELLKEYKISTGQLDRLRKNENVNTYTLNQLCKILDCRLEDIAEYIKE